MAKRPPRPTDLAGPPAAASIHTTFGELAKAEDALQRLLGAPLPFAVSYHIAKLARLVRAETLPHYHEKRAAWVRELGAPVPLTEEQRQIGVTQSFDVTPNNLPEFYGRMTELGKVPVEIAWRPIDVAALATVVISAADVAALQPLLTGELSIAAKDAA